MDVAYSSNENCLVAIELQINYILFAMCVKNLSLQYMYGSLILL